MSDITAPVRGTNNARGILLMLAAILLFSAMDAQAKFLSQELSVWQVIWARHFGLMVVIAAVLWPRLGRQVWRTKRPVVQVARGVAVLGSSAMFFFALQFVALADAVAVTFVGPMLVIAFGALVLKEHPRARHWAAVVVGFAATMVIIRPGTGVLHPAAFLVLGAAALFALHQTWARLLNDTDDITTTLSYTAVVGGVIMTAVVPFVWTTPESPLMLAMLMGLGVFAAAAEFTMIKAFISAPGAVIAPFQYTMMVWATFYGFVLFGDLPDGWTLLGAAILITTGLYSYYRDAAPGRQ